MSAIQHWKTVQKALGTTQDGMPGPNDLDAFYSQAEAAIAEWEKPVSGYVGPHKLSGRGLTIYVYGEDILMLNVRGTCFGGGNDPQDSGETASGISTLPPETLGVALPRSYCGPDEGTYDALCGSPIPADLPFEIPVEIYECATGKRNTYPFIDLGPNLSSTDNAVDLTVASAQFFDPSATATNFEIVCDVRIIGGAKYL